MTDQMTVICPKHGEHEHAITSNIPGQEGAWCQLCWLESLGPSLPYKLSRTQPNDLSRTQDVEFKTMDETVPVPEDAWKTMPKE